jgi:hypothetical protein
MILIHLTSIPEGTTYTILLYPLNTFIKNA